MQSSDNDRFDAGNPIEDESGSDSLDTNELELDHAALMQMEVERITQHSFGKWIKIAFAIFYFVFIMIYGTWKQAKSWSSTSESSHTNPLTFQESRYYQKVVKLDNGCKEDVEEWLVLVNELQEDSSVYFTYHWKNEMLITLDHMKSTCAVMDEISPVPEKFSTFHLYLNQMTDGYDRVIKGFEESIRDEDSSKMAEASKNFSTIKEYKEKAKAELDRIFTETDE